MLLAEHVSTVLENALLYEEVTLQKTLAETLLKSIPPGIVATDEEGIIRWFNPTAEQILGIAAADALNQTGRSVGQPARPRSCARRSSANANLAARSNGSIRTRGARSPSKPAG